MLSLANLKKEYDEISLEVNKKIQDVLNNGYFILGQELEEFEKDFSKYISKKYAIGVNSGSDALFMAVNALGIGEGDEVLTVSHTFISTVDSISRNGATPIFVDIEHDTYGIDPLKIEEKLTDKTKAILPVHLYGHPVDMEPLLEIANEFDLFIIEDACQAHGAEYKDVKVGGLGDIGCFSFYPTKNLGAYGDGGMIVTDDSELAERLRLLRNYGQPEKYYHDFIGLNSRLDEIQATILRIKLKYLDTWNERRRLIARIYNERLNDMELVLPVERGNSKHVYYVYVIRSKIRDFLQRELLKNGIIPQIHFPIPVHQQKAYNNYVKGVKLDITEKICGEILSLPMHPFLSEEEAIYVTEVLENALSKRDNAFL